MGVREDFEPYLDKNGYANPFPVSPGVGRSCDNVTLYTSEMYVILQKLGVANSVDFDKWEQLIRDSMQEPGLLSRYPGATTEQDSPDNMIGVLCASKVLKRPKIAREILLYGIRHFGCFDNVAPDTFSFKSMLWRQPQLFAGSIASAFPSWKNPLHILIRMLAFPLFLYASCVIFVSCIDEPLGSTDPRLLSWLLIQSVVPVSITCKLASLFWYHRLYSVYGSNGMKGVASIYFSPNGLNKNPYSKWWVTE
jgi:hypothetical protein